MLVCIKLGFPGGASGKEATGQFWTRKTCRFEVWVREDPLEEGVATHSNILAWRIPQMEEPGGLLNRVQRVGCN